MKHTCIVIFALCCHFSVTAQKTSLAPECELFAGFDMGATLPLPLPPEVRELGSWSPGLSGTLALQATHWVKPDRGLSLGLAIERKGMRATAGVKYWQTSIEVGEGEQSGRFSGTFSGENTTEMGGVYLVIPLCAAWRPDEGHWTFRCGGYAALLVSAVFRGTASDGYIRNGGPTGERISVDHATFDFSDRLRRSDFGLIASANRSLSARLSARGQLSWGLRPVLPDSFKGIPYKMYNVYSALGLSYVL
ncbi:MAG: PorT family protein [Tannerellaceae bacterium]|jgi:hypothetical protein|nr:PorT family protein [Tannerellaceae bacterium]